MMDLDHWAWVLKELSEKVTKIKLLSDKNYIGDHSTVLLEILDEVIEGLESK